MVRKVHKTWQRSTRPPPVDDLERAAIIAVCEAFIRDVLKPRFLPEIKPTDFGGVYYEAINNLMLVAMGYTPLEAMNLNATFSPQSQP